MPRVCLTEKQKKEAAERDAIKRMHEKVSSGLILKMNRENWTQQQVADVLGVSRYTVSNILSSQDYHISIETAFKLLYLLGLEVS